MLRYVVLCSAPTYFPFLFGFGHLLSQLINFLAPFSLVSISLENNFLSLHTLSNIEVFNSFFHVSTASCGGHYYV